MTEQWRPIPSAPGYEASDQGRVRSVDRVTTDVRGRKFTRRGRVLRPDASRKGGYPQVALSVGGVTRTRRVHHLVLEAFVGPRSVGLETRHLNGDPADNRLANLRYGTRAENTQDRVDHRPRCKRAHVLAEPNLIPGRRSGRACLACSRADSYVRHHPDLDLQTEADRYYRAIMACEPVNGRVPAIPQPRTGADYVRAARKASKEVA